MYKIDIINKLAEKKEVLETLVLEIDGMIDNIKQFENTEQAMEFIDEIQCICDVVKDYAVSSQEDTDGTA